MVNKRHLDEDQIFRSLVDMEDLSDALTGHLMSCGTCREKRAGLVKELGHLREMAEKLAPVPKKRIVLSPKMAPGARFTFPAFAKGLSVVALVVLIWFFFPFGGVDREVPLVQEETEGFALGFVEDILREFVYLENIQDEPWASSGYFTDEFLEFVTPLEEEPKSIREAV